MSLMLLAVSTCLVKALKGHTLAGERVLESDPTALRFTEDGRFKTDQTGPFISIFAHTSKASGLGQQPALLANGDVEIELLTGVTATMTSVADDDGHRKFDFIDLAPSSTNMDRTLNLMHRQIVDVLLADTFWAERFRQFAVVTVVDRAGVVSSEDGQRLAARQMKIKVNVLDEPLAEEIDAYHQWVDLGDEAASLPDGVTPFASFLWGLKTSEDASDCAMADEIAAMLSGDVLEWQAIAKSMGFTRDQMMALGLNPIDFDNPEQVVTGRTLQSTKLNRARIMDSIIEMRIDLESLKSAFSRSLKSGPVTHIDAKKGYRFSLGKDDDGGEMLSPWIPHPETMKSSIPLKEGDMVGVIAPNGDLRQGLMLRGGYSKDHESPNEDMAANVFEDAGVRISIANGALVIEAGGTTLSFSGDGLSISGGRVDHNGRNIGSSHVHGGVMPGGADTSTPH